jgi:predicted MFS family arabinose efflux permease
MDAWMLRYLDHDTAAYSKARAMGSVGYAVPMLFCGQLIHIFGYPAMIITASVYACITLGIAVLMTEQKEIGMIHSAKRPSFKKLFGNKKYAMMLAIVFLSGLAVAPMNNLKIIFLQEVGGNVSSLGIDSFIGVGCQALLICLSGNMHRVPAKIRLLVMSICMTAAMFFTMMAKSPMLVFLGTAVSNSSFGIMLPTVREITQKEVDASQVNTAYSLSDAMYSSAAAVAAMSYSGFMMDAFGTKSVCILGLGITILAMLLITVQWFGRKHKHASKISLAYVQK